MEFSIWIALRSYDNLRGVQYLTEMNTPETPAPASRTSKGGGVSVITLTVTAPHQCVHTIRYIV